MTGRIQTSLVVVVVVLMVMMSSRAAEASICHPASGCCEESNLSPGPLDRSYPNPEGGADDKLVGEMAFIYHCAQYFTSFLWYKRVPAVGLVPFPWDRAHNVSFFHGRHDNQTVVIKKLVFEDDAEYVFVASNGTHQINGTFRLYVHCSEAAPSFANHLPPQQVTALDSSKVLRCAAHDANCPHPIDPPTVVWEWKQDRSARGQLLKNDTLVNVNLDCGVKGKFSGQNCTVYIREVEALLYEGEFSCILIGSGESNLRQTVRLLPVDIEVKSWLPYVVGAAAGVVVVAAVMGLIWWRWHRLVFYCRRQPDRGKLARDAVILHGDDHADAVTRSLLPGLRDLGYDAIGEAEAARPDRPQLQEYLQAVEDSHSVILTFSTQELKADQQIHVLHQYVFRRKARHNVVVIRFHDNDSRPGRLPPDASGDVEAAQPLRNDDDSVWNTTELKSFKILNVSKALLLGESDQLGLTDRRNADKFWYTLRKYLPKLSDGSSRTSTRTRRNDSMADSERPLMSRSSMGRSESLTSECKTPAAVAGATGADMVTIDEEPAGRQRNDHNGEVPLRPSAIDGSSASTDDDEVFQETGGRPNMAGEESSVGDSSRHVDSDHPPRQHSHDSGTVNQASDQLSPTAAGTMPPSQPSPHRAGDPCKEISAIETADGITPQPTLCQTEGVSVHRPDHLAVASPEVRDTVSEMENNQADCPDLHNPPAASPEAQDCVAEMEGGHRRGTKGGVDRQESGYHSPGTQPEQAVTGSLVP